MALAQHSCTLCEEDSLNTQATSWCPECESFLCSECDRHHKRSKTSKHHVTVSVDAFNNLPDAVKSVTNICTDHAQIQEFYCPKHACACCLQCFNDKHIGCGEVKRLAEIVKNIKSSDRVTSFEFNLDCLKKDYDVILKHMRQRLESLDADKSKGMSDIKTMRLEVNNYMDIVEQTLVDRLNTECEQLRTETTKAIQEAELGQGHIDDTQKNLNAIVENATELQVYNYLESLEEQKECELIKIEKFKKTRELDTVKLEVEIPNALATIFKEIGNFGNVKLTTSNSDLVFATVSTSAVQNATQIHSNLSHTVDIDDIRVASFNTFTIPDDICTQPGITGCAVLDNDIVLLDQDNRKLYHFTKNGEFLKVVCSLSENPTDICSVKDYTVAVTIPATKTLSFINLTNGEPIKERKMDGECYGVSCDGETVVVTVHANSKTTVEIMGIDGKHISSFDLDNLHWIRVYSSKEKIYLSNFPTNSIVCCKRNGDIIWKIVDDFKKPLGLALDANGFILLVYRNNNSIVALSQNGDESKVLLSDKDGIHDPIAISTDNTNGRICVANRSNNKFFCFFISSKK